MVGGQGEPIDTVLRVLSRPRNRLVVRYLQDASVSNTHILALYVVDQYPESEGVREEKVRLHHRHLPRLDDHGLLEYDERSNTVRDESCDLAARVLAAIEEWQTEQ